MRSSYATLPPRPRPSHAPVYNPYDKFTQPEFDDWIHDITGVLKRALGRDSSRSPEPEPDVQPLVEIRVEGENGEDVEMRMNGEGDDVGSFVISAQVSDVDPSEGREGSLAVSSRVEDEEVEEEEYEESFQEFGEEEEEDQILPTSSPAHDTGTIDLVSSDEDEEEQQDALISSQAPTTTSTPTPRYSAKAKGKARDPREGPGLLALANGSGIVYPPAPRPRMGGRSDLKGAHGRDEDEEDYDEEEGEEVDEEEDVDGEGEVDDGYDGFYDEDRAEYEYEYDSGQEHGEEEEYSGSERYQQAQEEGYDSLEGSEDGGTETVHYAPFQNQDNAYWAPDPRARLSAPPPQMGAGMGTSEDPVELFDSDEEADAAGEKGQEEEGEEKEEEEEEEPMEVKRRTESEQFDDPKDNGFVPGTYTARDGRRYLRESFARIPVWLEDDDDEVEHEEEEEEEEKGEQGGDLFDDPDDFGEPGIYTASDGSSYIRTASGYVNRLRDDWREASYPEGAIKVSQADWDEFYELAPQQYRESAMQQREERLFGGGPSLSRGQDDFLEAQEIREEDERDKKEGSEAGGYPESIASFRYPSQQAPSQEGPVLEQEEKIAVDADADAEADDEFPPPTHTRSSSNLFLPSPPQVELADPWAAPEHYAEDLYKGGDVPADVTDPNRLGANDGDVTVDEDKQIADDDMETKSYRLSEEIAERFEEEEQQHQQQQNERERSVDSIMGPASSPPPREDEIAEAEADVDSIMGASSPPRNSEGEHKKVGSTDSIMDDEADSMASSRPDETQDEPAPAAMNDGEEDAVVVEPELGDKLEGGQGVGQVAEASADDTADVSTATETAVEKDEELPGFGHTEQIISTDGGAEGEHTLSATEPQLPYPEFEPESTDAPTAEIPSMEQMILSGPSDLPSSQGGDEARQDDVVKEMFTSYTNDDALPASVDHDVPMDSAVIDPALLDVEAQQNVNGETQLEVDFDDIEVKSTTSSRPDLYEQIRGGLRDAARMIEEIRQAQTTTNGLDSSSPQMPSVAGLTIPMPVTADPANDIATPILHPSSPSEQPLAMPLTELLGRRGPSKASGLFTPLEEGSQGGTGGVATPAEAEVDSGIDRAVKDASEHMDISEDDQESLSKDSAQVLSVDPSILSRPSDGDLTPEEEDAEGETDREDDPPSTFNNVNINDPNADPFKLMGDDSKVAPKAVEMRDEEGSSGNEKEEGSPPKTPSNGFKLKIPPLSKQTNGDGKSRPQTYSSTFAPEEEETENENDQAAHDQQQKRKRETGEASSGPENGTLTSQMRAKRKKTTRKHAEQNNDSISESELTSSGGSVTSQLLRGTELHPPILQQPEMSSVSQTTPTSSRPKPPKPAFSSTSVQRRHQHKPPTAVAIPQSGSSQPGSPVKQVQYASSPVTRSNCQFHKISIPKDEASGKLITFIVPGCSLGNKEFMDDEDIVDLGVATVDDYMRRAEHVETLNFTPELIAALRFLVGVELFQEGEVYYLPEPGEVVQRKIKRKRTADRQSISRPEREVPTVVIPSLASRSLTYSQSLPSPLSKSSATASPVVRRGSLLSPKTQSSADVEADSPKSKMSPHLLTAGEINPEALRGKGSYWMASSLKSTSPNKARSHRLEQDRRTARRLNKDAVAYEPTDDEGSSSSLTSGEDDDWLTARKKRKKRKSQSRTSPLKSSILRTNGSHAGSSGSLKRRRSSAAPDASQTEGKNGEPEFKKPRIRPSGRMEEAGSTP